MAKKNNRTCIVCGKKYSYCNTCSEDRNKEPWHSIYCSDNCKNIFYTASDYYTEAFTQEELKARFDACDLSYKNNFHKSIVEAINAVYNTDMENKNDVSVEKEKEIISVDIAPVEQTFSFTKHKKEKYTK